MMSYSPVTIWVSILVIGLITYAIRLSFIYLFGAVDGAPEWLEHALEYVPPAVFAALAIPSILTVDATLSASLINERTIAGVLAAAAAWQTEDVFVTIAVGMGSLWLFRFVIL